MGQCPWVAAASPETPAPGLLGPACHDIPVIEEGDR